MVEMAKGRRDSKGRVDRNAIKLRAKAKDQKAM